MKRIRNSTSIVVLVWFALFAALAVAEDASNTAPSNAPGNERATSPAVVRCAVIGGMIDTDLWPEIAKRFEAATGHGVEIVAWGPKREIARAFAAGEADLIVMHSSDTMINLVADGHGVDPQPWARNDLLIVGPPDDPAKIRGEKDAAHALRRIVASKSRLLIHASLGVNEVLNDLLADGEIQLDPTAVLSLPSDKHRQMLRRASEERAYTLVGRIPYLNAKIERHDMEIMVQGDRRLRRPYLVVVAKPNEKNVARQAAAQRLATFLRSAETQAWLAEFGKGVLDDHPLFFPVAAP